METKTESVAVFHNRRHRVTGETVRVHARAFRERRGPSGWDRQRRNALTIAAAGGMCVLCGRPASEVDHRVPLSLGGDDCEENRRAVCVACHKRLTRELQRGSRVQKLRSRR